MEGFFSLEGWLREIAARKRGEGRIGSDQIMALCTKEMIACVIKLFFMMIEMPISLL